MSGIVDPILDERGRSFPKALEGIALLLEGMNPGQKITIERLHIDRDGRYFSVTVEPPITEAQARHVREG